MLVTTYGEIYEPKLIYQEYDLAFYGENDREVAESMYELLKDESEDVYIEEGRAYVPMIHYYTFNHLDYTFVHVPRAEGINMYIPKNNLREFLKFLKEYMRTKDYRNVTLKDFIKKKLKNKSTSYLYPRMALYYGDYIYLFYNGVEVILPW